MTLISTPFWSRSPYIPRISALSVRKRKLFWSLPKKKCQLPGHDMRLKELPTRSCPNDDTLGSSQNHAGSHVPNSSKALCWKILACEHRVLQLGTLRVKPVRGGHKSFQDGRETSAALRRCCKGRTVVLRIRPMLVSEDRLSNVSSRHVERRMSTTRFERVVW